MDYQDWLGWGLQLKYGMRDHAWKFRDMVESFLATLLKYYLESGKHILGLEVSRKHIPSRLFQPPLDLYSQKRDFPGQLRIHWDQRTQ